MEKTNGISQRSVLRTWHQDKFHPYRMSLHRDLYCNDFLKRVNFCNWIRRKMRTDVLFLSHVLFSDEAIFANTGTANRQIVGAALSAITSFWSIFFWRLLDWASLRKLSRKRTASINGRRALACSHEHVDAKRRCTTPLCSVFKTNDEWDFLVDSSPDLNH